MASIRLRGCALLALALAGCTTRREGDARPPAAARPAVNPAIGPQSEAALSDPRAQIFLTKGCPQCHSISALQVVSPTNAGPDLALAETDVRSRFNTTLPQFLHSPTGTMQIVLSSQITLSPAERDSIVKLLHEITEARNGQR